jgi:tight adherence protein C
MMGVSAGGAGVAVLAGATGFGVSRVALEAVRDLATTSWIAGASRQAAATLRAPRGLALIALTALGRAQETWPPARRVSDRLHAGPVRWLGDAAPSSALWLASKEAVLLVAGLLFTWLADDVLIGAVVGLAAAFLPDLVVRDRWERRQERIRRELPDVLDLLTLALDAGLSLDAGLQQVAETLRGGILKDAIARMLGEVRFGARRHQAWRDMAARLGNPDVAEIMQALIQADTMGVGLAQALRGLAQSMRQRRRQRVEEAAQKAPVKLLFPLALFVFPSIFIVLLGPVFLQLLEVVP